MGGPNQEGGGVLEGIGENNGALSPINYRGRYRFKLEKTGLLRNPRRKP